MENHGLLGKFMFILTNSAIIFNNSTILQTIGTKWILFQP